MGIRKWNMRHRKEKDKTHHRSQNHGRHRLLNSWEHGRVSVSSADGHLYLPKGMSSEKHHIETSLKKPQMIWKVIIIHASFIKEIQSTCLFNLCSLLLCMMWGVVCHVCIWSPSFHGKYVYLLSHLTSPHPLIFFNCIYISMKLKSSHFHIICASLYNNQNSNVLLCLQRHTFDQLSVFLDSLFKKNYVKDFKD